MKILNGEQALAYGAVAAGVKMVTAYPGSPSSGAVETIIRLAEKHGIYIEWSSNEKVAAEMAIGASIAGRRALVCTKSVGMNVMIDPLMALNLTPVNGGLVILLGDDPGGYGSQNDQDSRPFASILEMPMLEPAGSGEAYIMMQEAFAVSERFHSPVIIRVTRSFSQRMHPVPIKDLPVSDISRGLVREPWRFVPAPPNVVKKHKDLHAKLENIKLWMEKVAYNQIHGRGAKGIVGAGYVFQKLLDVLGNKQLENLQLLKLSSLFPLPENILVEFLKGCDKVLVLEENEPYLEILLKAFAQEKGYQVEYFGKQNGHVPREGELFRWQIQAAVEEFLPGFAPSQTYLKENEKEEIPKKKDHCRGSRYGEILDILDEAAKSLNQKPVLVGDPGCLVKVAERLDAKYALGSAVGVADGLSKAGIQERAVAIFGDSSFFHTSLPAICNAVYNRSRILMIILDNKATATSGFQPHPGVGKDALGRKAPALNIEQIARACGVKYVCTVDPDDPGSDLKELFCENLRRRELALIVIRLK